MQMTLHLDGTTANGGSSLVMHNERLADPLDPFSEAIAAISKIRKKTSANFAEMGRLEFYAGLYTNPKIENPTSINGNVPVLPAWNILRCLQDGAKRHKRGLDVLRGVYPIGEFATLEYDGPHDPLEMWKSGTFSLRKTVGVRSSRVMRTRPQFMDWSASLDIEVDMTIWDTTDLRTAWTDAGKYSGLGEMRPVYGRFAGTIDAETQKKGKAA